MPITGPFTRTEFSGSGPSYHRTITTRRQSPPYRLRLAYEARVSYNDIVANPFGLGTANCGTYSFDVTSSPLYAQAHAAAYSRFKDALFETADLGVSLAERKQSVDMVSQRALQILNAARHLKSFRFTQAIQALGLEVLSKKETPRLFRAVVRRPGGSVVTRKRGGKTSIKRRFRPVYEKEITLRKSAKSFGKNFLEIHFGWSPLVQDIGNAVEVMHSPVFKGLGKVVKARGSANQQKPLAPTTMSNYSLTSQFYWTTKVQLISDVTVTDPNLLNLSRLGFVNPASLLWETVPFSFLVDWFVNVGDVLNSYTDFVGMNLNNSCTTVYSVIKEDRYYKGNVPGAGIQIRPINTRTYVSVKRSTGISGPTLQIKPFNGFSLARGVTAVSLLTQFLRT